VIIPRYPGQNEGFTVGGPVVRRVVAATDRCGGRRADKNGGTHPERGLTTTTIVRHRPLQYPTTVTPTTARHRATGTLDRTRWRCGTRGTTSLSRPTAGRNVSGPGPRSACTHASKSYRRLSRPQRRPAQRTTISSETVAFTKTRASSSRPCRGRLRGSFTTRHCPMSSDRRPVTLRRRPLIRLIRTRSVPDHFPPISDNCRTPTGAYLHYDVYPLPT